MPSREELKALIDALSEDSLDMVKQMLEHYLSPPTLKPEFERTQRRGNEYREQVMRRFKETRKPGTIGMMGGSGGAGTHQGISFGRHSFHYWDDKALVFQTMQSFDGQSIEIMERLSFSDDRSTLICSLELSNGGHTIRHQDEFPIAQDSAT